MKSPTKDDADRITEEVDGTGVGTKTPDVDVDTTPTKKKPVTTAAACPILAYLNFRFEFLHGTLMCEISELQVAKHDGVRRKGVGKFMLMLAEMCAKNAGMSGVMVTVQLCYFAVSWLYLRSNLPRCVVNCHFLLPRLIHFLSTFVRVLVWY